MSKLELREGVGVYTPGDEQVGTVTGFVLDPSTNEVTHIVVQKGWLFPEDKVLSFDMIASADEDKVVLKGNLGDIDELPAFENTHFITPRDADITRQGGSEPAEERRRADIIQEEASEGRSAALSVAPAYYWYPPHGYVGYPVGYYGLPPMETVRNIPADTIPVKEGTDIMSSDGKHVGDVERLLIDADSNKLTHFVISQGVFFKDRKLVPAHWVRSMDEDKVHLSVNSELLEQLPSYEA
ncbi:MAG TPA: PRC-barrel domain-containing protein [Anaerolineales bacterium]|nr:PRC-barrel domain-containing protein [Anaerolineales bacterium]